MSHLKLTRPVVFFDIESTGTNPTKDKIVELSLLKITPSGEELTYHTLIHPGAPIPPEAIAVHGITDEDVSEAPPFGAVAKVIAGFMEDCDLGGYNCRKFDIPLLAEEFHRAEVPIDLRSRRVVDVQVIFHKRERRTLSAAYEFYCGKPLEGAHSADADTRATYEVLLGQMERYPDLPHDMEGLDEYTSHGPLVDFMGRFVYDGSGRIVFNFGKYKGLPVEQVLIQSPGYYDWMMNGDFAADTLHVLRRIKMDLDSRQAPKHPQG